MLTKVKLYRNTALLILITVFLCFAGCSYESFTVLDTHAYESSISVASEQPSLFADTVPVTQSADPNREVYEIFLEHHKEEIIAYIWLPGGGILMMMETPAEAGAEPEAGNIVMYQITAQGRNPNVQELRLTGPIAGKVPIFFDEDWRDRYEDENHQIITSYDSGFVQMEGQNGDLLLIEVFPNRVRGIPYEDSEFYGIKPEDTFGTKPMEVLTPNWNEGYPAWFFVLEPQSITPDYELRYGAYILTGEDILMRTWKIGEAWQFPVFD